jgi:hypothetical protein
LYITILFPILNHKLNYLKLSRKLQVIDLYREINYWNAIFKMKSKDKNEQNKKKEKTELNGYNIQIETNKNHILYKKYTRRGLGNGIKKNKFFLFFGQKFPGYFENKKERNEFLKIFYHKIEDGANKIYGNGIISKKNLYILKKEFNNKKINVWEFENESYINKDKIDEIKKYLNLIEENNINNNTDLINNNNTDLSKINYNKEIYNNKEYENKKIDHEENKNNFENNKKDFNNSEDFIEIRKSKSNNFF